MSNAKTMNLRQALWSGPSGVKSTIQQTGRSVGTMNLRSAHTASNRRCARLGSSHLLADVLSGESAAALSAFETSDVPLPLQGQQRLTLFDLLATAGTVYNTEEDKDRVRAAPTLLVRPLSSSSSSLPESLPDGSLQIQAAGWPEAAARLSARVQEAAGKEATASSVWTPAAFQAVDCWGKLTIFMFWSYSLLLFTSIC